MVDFIYGFFVGFLVGVLVGMWITHTKDEIVSNELIFTGEETNENNKIRRKAFVHKVTYKSGKIKYKTHNITLA